MMSEPVNEMMPDYQSVDISEGVQDRLDNINSIFQGIHDNLEHYNWSRSLAFFNNSLDMDMDMCTNGSSFENNPVCQEPEMAVDPFAMPLWRQVIWTLFFFMMVATAALGNIIVIWIVISDKRMRSVTNYFIVNLSIADILNATSNVSFNFIYMLTGHWPFGLVYCKLGQFLSILSVCGSVFTLVAISVDRYNAILHPLRPRLSRMKTIGIATSIWIVGINIGVPQLLYFTMALPNNTAPGEPERIQCVSVWPDANPEENFTSKIEYGYNVAFMIVTYFLPLTFMSFTYSRIGFELWGSRAIGEASGAQVESIKSKRKVVKMMMMVVMIFLVCWLPYHTYFILSHVAPSINHTTYIQDIYLTIYWLAMSNSMYNPMIYCYMNQRFRKGFRKVLDVVLCRRPDYNGQKDQLAINNTRSRQYLHPNSEKRGRSYSPNNGSSPYFNSSDNSRNCYPMRQNNGTTISQATRSYHPTPSTTPTCTERRLVTKSNQVTAGGTVAQSANKISNENTEPNIGNFSQGDSSITLLTTAGSQQAICATPSQPQNCGTVGSHPLNCGTVGSQPGICGTVGSQPVIWNSQQAMCIAANHDNLNMCKCEKLV